MFGYTPPGLGMSPTQNGVGNYSPQNLGQLMPWGANPYGALHSGLQQISQAPQQPMAPMWGGGMPQQNLAMFGQAAQQPMGGMPNNYFAAILQAMQGGGGMQQAPQQVPNPMNWQPQATAPTQQPSFIANLGQITPPAPAAAAPAGTTPEQQALINWLYWNQANGGTGAGPGDAGGGNGGNDTGGDNGGGDSGGSAGEG